MAENDYLPTPGIESLEGSIPLSYYNQNAPTLDFNNRYNLGPNAQQDMGGAPMPVGLNALPSAGQISRAQSYDDGLGISSNVIPPAALTHDRGPGGLDYANTAISGVGTAGGIAGLVTKTAAAGSGAAGLGVLGTMAAAAPIVGAVGGLVALGVSWYYNHKAQKEAERVARENERRAAEAAAEEKRRFEINLEMTKAQTYQQNKRLDTAQALQSSQIAHSQEMDEERLEMQKLDKKEQSRQNRVNQAINLLLGTVKMFNSPQNREKSYNFWANKAATTPAI